MENKKITKEERRLQLIKVASELFTERGYYDTKTKDIASAAGVTEPIIYKHFASKQELFFEVIYQIASKLIDSLNINEKIEPEKFMQKFIYLHMENVDKHFNSIKFILVQMINEPEIRETFKNTLLPKMKMKLHPLIKNLSYEKVEKSDSDYDLFELDLFLLGGMLMFCELAQGLFKYSPAGLDRQELSEKLAVKFVSIINNPKEKK